LKTNPLLLAARSLLWTLLLPGVVAGFIPWRYFGVGKAQVDWSNPRQLLGVAAITAGGLLLAACIVDFARRGRGTLSPMDPPKELVVQGLYRSVRNPMYLSVLTIILGEALLTGSWALVGYGAGFFLLANLFVLGFEEPKLRRMFGASYELYCQQVGRWVPRLGTRD